jgi:hypothetical protein
MPAATLITSSPSQTALAISAMASANSRYGLPSGEDLLFGRPQVGDRHLKMHEDRDDLAKGVHRC